MGAATVPEQITITENLSHITNPVGWLYGFSI